VKVQAVAGRCIKSHRYTYRALKCHKFVSCLGDYEDEQLVGWDSRTVKVNMYVMTEIYPKERSAYKQLQRRGLHKDVLSVVHGVGWSCIDEVFFL
jgi:hypothetical protein